MKAAEINLFKLKSCLGPLKSQAEEILAKERVAFYGRLNLNIHSGRFISSLKNTR